MTKANENSSVPLTPGAIWLWLRQKFGKGLDVAWYRDVIRPRILGTDPVRDTSDKTCEIHVLTSAADWLNCMWTLKSFYAMSGRKYALCIHEDGSLAEADVDNLQKHFPDARIIRRTDADAHMDEALRMFPRSLKFRQTNRLAPKLFDFAVYLESDRMGLFDSDLLFFAEPTAFLEKVEDANYKLNIFNADCNDSYSISPERVRELMRHDLTPRINSGFGLVQRDSLKVEWVEEYLAMPEVLEGHWWRIEQTLIALCSSRYGAELLPEEYTLRLERGIGSRPFRHYVGGIRHLMYSEGMRALQSSGLLRRQS